MPGAAQPLVYFISDGSIDDLNYETRSDDLLRLLAKVLAANIPLAQIREKQLSTRRLFDLACRAVAIAQGSRTRLLINDRLDVALAARADGVHLTGGSIRPDLVRRSAPDGFVIGVSTHSVEDITLAAEGGADFAVFGPVFDSPGKSMGVGTELLTRAVDAAGDLPVLGLGGINEANYRDVIATGAAGFAGIRFLNCPRNLDSLRAELQL